jgi:hypothetical protein
VNQALTSETEHFFEQSRAVIAQHGYCTLGALTGILYFTEMGPIDALSSANAHLSALELTEPSLYWRCTSMRFRCQSLRIQGHQQAASALGEQTFALAKSHSLYQDAHLALELLTFMSLDRNSLEEAQHWLDNMSALNGRTRDLERIVALGHARDRYEMQSGNFGQIAERLLGRFDGIQSDRRVGNQSAELSTLAFCLAGAGRISEALEIVPVALDALAPIRGRFTGDYPVELVARTLRLAGNPKAADHLTFNHVIESRQKYSRPIPEFFEELSRAAAGLTNHPH